MEACLLLKSMSAVVSSSTANTECVGNNSGCRLRNVVGNLTSFRSTLNRTPSTVAATNHTSSAAVVPVSKKQKQQLEQQPIASEHHSSGGGVTPGQTSNFVVSGGTIVTAAVATNVPAGSSAIATNPSVRQCCFHWCCCCPCSCLAIKVPQSATAVDETKIETTKTDFTKIFREMPSVQDVITWGESFDRLMRSEDGRNIFREFLRSEYSEENMLFWLCCEDLKRQTVPSIIEEKARFIYEDFISILSPKEVSLDSRVRDIVNRNMVSPTANMFDEAQAQIYTLMHRDSYPRFINSQIYKDLKTVYNIESTSSSSKKDDKASLSRGAGSEEQSSITESTRSSSPKPQEYVAHKSGGEVDPSSRKTKESTTEQSVRKDNKIGSPEVRQDPEGRSDNGKEIQGHRSVGSSR